MFNAEIKKSGKVKVLYLSGPLTIDHAGEIKKAFQEGNRILNAFTADIKS